MKTVMSLWQDWIPYFRIMKSVTGPSRPVTATGRKAPALLLPCFPLPLASNGRTHRESGVPTKTMGATSVSCGLSLSLAASIIWNVPCCP